MKALDRLLTFPRIGGDGILDRMQKLVSPLTKTPWWQKDPVIKIVGTNGKGTVANMLSHWARFEGVNRVGLYTSPHIFSPLERIQINNQNIAAKDFERVLNIVMDLVLAPEKTGRFEILTAAALTHFCAQDVDLAVMEIGLGGRLDPVKIAPGWINILTSVDLEHTHLLGTTRSEIATEKAAICKEGDVLFSGIAPDILIKNESVSVYSFQASSKDFDHLNRQLCLHALEAFLSRKVKVIDPDLPRLIGRFQHLENDPDMIVDVAHTADAIEAALNKIGEGNHLIFIALAADKNIEEIKTRFHLSGHTYVFVVGFDSAMEKQAYRDFMPEARVINLDAIVDEVETFQKTNAGKGKILYLGGFEIVRYAINNFEKKKQFECVKL